MKSEVIDELETYVNYLRDGTHQTVPTFQYIEVEKLQALCNWWSCANFFAYSFPVDVIRKIFMYLPADVYFKFAHSLNKRMRQYAFDDLVVLRISFAAKRTVNTTYRFYHKHTFTLMNLQINHNPKTVSMTFGKYINQGSIHVYYATTNKRIAVSEWPRRSGQWGKSEHNVITYWKSLGQKGATKSETEAPPKNAHFSHLILFY